MKALNNEMVAYHPKIYTKRAIHTSGDIENKIVNFKLNGNFYNLIINIKNIESNNYRVFLEKSRLMIVVAVNHLYAKPTHIHNLESISTSQLSYEVMRHVEVWLPADNFYLLRHFLDVEEGNLKIILKDTRLSFN